jgi:hypothetical protein
MGAAFYDTGKDCEKKEVEKRNWEELSTSNRQVPGWNVWKVRRGIIARFRCGNEANGNKFWLEEKRVCRTCRGQMKTTDHVS